MPTMLNMMLNEFHEEAAVTKRVLERVPADKLSWKPHVKSMPLGQLAMHVATIPGNFARMAQLNGLDVLQGGFETPLPKTSEEILAALEQSVFEVEECLDRMTEEASQETWSLRMGEKVLFSRPRIGVLRSVMLNHWYHHRGQLSVYLRLLDVPVPAIYGPSADENPFV